ncbi:MAG: ribokinase [Dehalococcoidia bacterium]|nr:ribokinase [Dehalococcoidia bacterium]
MKPRVVVVGSLMMDLVVRAPRLPVIGESLLSHSFRTSPGGKGGNQAIAAARLGASVTMIGQVGADRFGEILRERLEAEGVDTRFVSVDPELGTGVAVPIVLDSGENAILAVPQANLTLSPLLMERARDVISSAGMLLVQFEVNMDATLAAMRLAEAARVPILLNPAPVAPYPPGTLELASVIVANEIEAAALVPSASGDHDAEVEVLRRLSRSAVITLGHDGAVVDDGSGPRSIPPFAVQAVDSVGAGDAFCAGLALSLCEGAPLASAAHFAAAAGAVAVTRAGAQASLPTRQEVEALLAGR